MNDDELNAIRARRKAITRGRWVADEGAVVESSTKTTVARYVAPADAEFIARAPADIDALLAEVERLTAEHGAARAIVEGRAKAPTEKEVEAHWSAEGFFRYRTEDGGVGAVHSRYDLRLALRAIDGDPARWWAFDATGRPTAWPVVTPVAEPT